MSSDRTVRSLVTSYWHPDGSFNHALRGERISVRADYVAQFDRLDGQEPQPEKPKRAKAES